MPSYARKTVTPEIREFREFSGDPSAQMREAYEVAAWMLQFTADGVFPVFEYNEAEPVTDSMRLYLRHPGGRTFFSFGAIRPGDFIVYENGFWNVYSATQFHSLYVTVPDEKYAPDAVRHDVSGLAGQVWDSHSGQYVTPSAKTKREELEQYGPSGFAIQRDGGA